MTILNVGAAYYSRVNLNKFAVNNSSSVIPSRRPVEERCRGVSSSVVLIQVSHGTHVSKILASTSAVSRDHFYFGYICSSISTYIQLEKMK